MSTSQRGGKALQDGLWRRSSAGACITHIHYVSLDTSAEEVLPQVLYFSVSPFGPTDASACGPEAPAAAAAGFWPAQVAHTILSSDHRETLIFGLRNGHRQIVHLG